MNARATSERVTSACHVMATRRGGTRREASMMTMPGTGASMLINGTTAWPTPAPTSRCSARLSSVRKTTSGSMPRDRRRASTPYELRP